MASNAALSKSRIRRMAEVLGGYVDSGKAPGIVALTSRRDSIHVEAIGKADLVSGTPMRRDTIFRLASMTKPVTAVAAMILVEETKLRLDDPIDRWLPELADRKVLRSIESPPDDTVPANRTITLRDLLTFRLGFGAIMAMPGTYPIQDMIGQAGLAPSPVAPPLTPDAWISRLATLPLLHQPGERWMYHTGSDILGVLISRVAGMSLGDFFQERIFGPLGMTDTGFSVPIEKIDRLATCYRTDPATGNLTVADEARGGVFSRPPAFEAGSAGLVSTADDFDTFGRMLLSGGRHGERRILARPTVELMMTDHITADQKGASLFFPGFWDMRGWGLGAATVTTRSGIGPSVGSFTWDGGFGTSWCSDPREDMVTILLTQKMMTGPDDHEIKHDFWTLAYAAIED